MSRKRRCVQRKSRMLITIGWDLGEKSVDVTVFEKLMRTAKKAKLVDRWDDGRGRDMWYQAWRGSDERALRAACIQAIGTEPSKVRVV